MGVLITAGRKGGAISLVLALKKLALGISYCRVS
jgi:hypothetical protein